MVQELLVKKGYKLRIDGMCGYNTVKAIRKYQSHFMQVPDAIVDKDGSTFKHLIAGEPGSAPAPNLPPIQNPQAVGDIGGVKYPAKTMTISSKGICLLKAYETLKLYPYYDQDKNAARITEWLSGATIGYGHLIKDKVEFQNFKTDITEHQAETLFRSDIIEFIDAVRNYVLVNLTQNEFDALVIFAYNVGVQSPSKGFRGSTVLKVINGLSNEDLDTSWKKFAYSHGAIMKGLIKRRQSELDVFHKGIYIKS
nr:glycoside hydrolase family protein [Erwinia mallotivora]